MGTYTFSQIVLIMECIRAIIDYMNLCAETAISKVFFCVICNICWNHPSGSKWSAYSAYIDTSVPRLRCPDNCILEVSVPSGRKFNQWTVGERLQILEFFSKYLVIIGRKLFENPWHLLSPIWKYLVLRSQISPDKLMWPGVCLMPLALRVLVFQDSV